jgi:hypothetical protein
MNYCCYQITLRVELLIQIVVLRSVDWIFIIGAPAWCDWTNEYVTLYTTFHNLLLKKEMVAAPVIATLSRPLFKI